MGNNLTTHIQARFAVTLCALFLVFLAFPTASFGQSAKPANEQAVELLKSNEPAKAKALLIEQIEAEPSAIAFANLAAAELALKNQGEAAYAFEMARALGGFSGSGDFRQNLQKHLPAELRSLSDGPLRKVIQPLARSLPDNSFAAMALFFGLFACMLGLAFMFRSEIARKSWSAVVLFALVVLCVLGLVLAKAQSNYRNPSSGVVLQSTQLYEAPSVQSERIRSLPEGAVVMVGELLSGTYQVTLPTGKVGWVPEGDIRMVKVDQLPE